MASAVKGDFNGLSCPYRAYSLEISELFRLKMSLVFMQVLISLSFYKLIFLYGVTSVINN